MTGFEPEYLIPDDLDEFWGAALDESRRVPLDFRRSRSNDFELEGFTVETIEFMGMNQLAVSGWLAIPNGLERGSAFLWVPPYGRESLLPNAYGTRKDMISMSLNLHHLGAFHQESYVPERGYMAEGAATPETWIFRRMWQDCCIALRVLQAQYEVLEEQIGAMGMSQGAGLSIWLGAYNPIVKAVCADMPFLGNMKETLNRQAYRYPLKELIDFIENEPLGKEKVMHTLSYFDTCHMATRCKVPTHVSLGLKDPAARPESVRAIHGAIAGENELVEYDWGHDWHPEMVGRNREWFRRNLN